MNLQPINVDYSKARDSLNQYLSIVKEKRTAEDHAIIRSTKAILRGHKVIRLADAVRSGGVDSRGFPKIAIARADDKFVRCRTRGNHCDMISTETRDEYIAEFGVRRSWASMKKQGNPRGFNFRLSGTFQQSVEANAIVPSIPPQHRVTEAAAERFYIMFEAEWGPTAPVDPALLSPLGGGLFAVVAVWDLTDIERAVLANARGV
jgi:hypothetical protein